MSMFSILVLVLSACLVPTRDVCSRRLFSSPFSSCAARHSRSAIRARSHQSPPSRYELCSFPDIVCGRDSRREVTPALAESKSSCREQITTFLSAKHFALRLLSRSWEVVTKLFMHGPRSEIFEGSERLHVRFFCREQIELQRANPTFSLCKTFCSQQKLRGRHQTFHAWTSL